ncbi:LD-carboxypeptidase [Deinococcus radiophilus]|uniref:LD-carboxypeptidase n=1 Tax=Deinococcus radiophilus TaxID=32062 RepID=UPI003618C28A
MDTPTFLRPRPLTSGSRVAALSLSSGFVTEVPHRYAAGVRQAAESLGWDIVPAPNAFRGPDYLYANPQARADDLHWALTNPEIDGMVSIIGGDDSIRLLPYLDLALIRAHPKVFLGYSDATVTLTQFLRAGVMAYHGPAVLTDLAENGGIHPYVAQSLRQAFGGKPMTSPLPGVDRGRAGLGGRGRPERAPRVSAGGRLDLAASGAGGRAPAGRLHRDSGHAERHPGRAATPTMARRGDGAGNQQRRA